VNTSLEFKNLAAKIPFLNDRARMLQNARHFFAERGVLEVDCPALSRFAPIDLHIEVMKVEGAGYLHTSPEYAMKRLLSAGMGDIYQIGHVFRAQEVGPYHNPEFTMAEWYRLGFTFEQMIEETLDFIRLFLGPLPSLARSYRSLIREHLGIDYTTSALSDLLTLAAAHQLDLPKEAPSWDKDTLLQLLISFLIEPKLGEGRLFVLTDYPASQAALSKTRLLPDQEAVACRFEVYYNGIELANGYHELTDAAEQRKRLESANRARIAAGKEPLRIDEHFLEALERGLPDCCGVAVGFDRLMQLKHGLATLHPILPLSWEEV
jgi:lysyl-tRNA synthetase class 2